MSEVNVQKENFFVNGEDDFNKFVATFDHEDNEWKTFMEEKYNTNRNCFAPIRVIKIFGADSMLSWLKLRMERYTHQQEALNAKPEIMVLEDEQEKNI